MISKLIVVAVLITVSLREVQGGEDVLDGRQRKEGEGGGGEGAIFRMRGTGYNHLSTMTRPQQQQQQQQTTYQVDISDDDELLIPTTETELEEEADYQRRLFGVRVNGVRGVDNDYLRSLEPFAVGMEVGMNDTLHIPETCTLLDECADFGGLISDNSPSCFDGNMTEMFFKITNMSYMRNVIIRLGVEGDNGFNMSYVLPSVLYSAEVGEPLHLDYSVTANYCMHIYILDGQTGDEIAYIHRLPGVLMPIRPSTTELPFGVYFGSGENLIII